MAHCRHLDRRLRLPTIAPAAVTIGVAQWWSARNKLKLDLFNLRWAAYVTRDLLGEMFTSGKISIETEAVFRRRAAA